jgi:hypothetical protein
MSAAEFGFRFTSKSEIYKFLTVDAGAYLPPASQITIYFMKDLISGKKLVSTILLNNPFESQFIKGSQVKWMSAPCYMTITI